jgi:hypothetical protein
MNNNHFSVRATLNQSTLVGVEKGRWHNSIVPLEAELFTHMSGRFNAFTEYSKFVPFIFAD